MTIGFYIASAAGWDPVRRVSLERLQALVPQAVAVISQEREHSSIWALRMYRRAIADGHSHCFFLNDDGTVPKNLAEIAAAMVEAVPAQVFALATIVPEADKPGTGPWLRSYLQTGPFYAYPREDLIDLLAYHEALPLKLRAKMNEDEVAAHHAWNRQKPIWQSVPSLFLHNLDVPSTLGYDHHPNRVAKSMWDPGCEEVLATLSYWMPTAEPPTVPHPWLTVGQLNAVRRMVRGEEDAMLCSYCAERDGMFTSPQTGARICARCLDQIMGHILQNLRAG